MLFALTFAGVGLFIDSLYSLLSSAVSGWLRGRGAAFQRWQRYIAGGTYLALGAVGAVSEPGRN